MTKAIATRLFALGLVVCATAAQAEGGMGKEKDAMSGDHMGKPTTHETGTAMHKGGKTHQSDGGMGKQDMTKDGMGKDEMGKDGMAKDAMGK